MRLFAPGIVVDYEFEMEPPVGGPRLVYFKAGGGEAGARIVPHAHPYYEIVLITEGACVQEVDGVSSELRVGEMAFAKPGQTHELLGCPPTGWRHYCLAFDVSALPEIGLTFGRSNSPRIASCEDLVELCARMRDEASQSRLGAPQMIQSLLTEFVLQIARRMGRPAADRPLRAHSDVVEQALVYIERSSRHGLSVGEIARAVCVSPSLLTRRFSAEMHTPVHRYARSLVMQRAASLLEQGRLNVSEIADELGFPSIHLFSSSFKAHWGVSPTEYRRRLTSAG